MSSTIGISLSRPLQAPAVVSAAAITGSRQLDVINVPLPQPGPGELRIKLEGCGVCASNLDVWKGQPWFEYPLDAGAPGHEGWGRIDTTDPAWPDLKLGDRVAFLSGHAYAE